MISDFAESVRDEQWVDSILSHSPVFIDKLCLRRNTLGDTCDGADLEPGRSENEPFGNLGNPLKRKRITDDESAESDSGQIVTDSKALKRKICCLWLYILVQTLKLKKEVCYLTLGKDEDTPNKDDCAVLVIDSFRTELEYLLKN